MHVKWHIPAALGTTLAMNGVYSAKKNSIVNTAYRQKMSGTVSFLRTKTFRDMSVRKEQNSML